MAEINSGLRLASTDTISKILVASFEKMEVVLLILHGCWAGTGLKDGVKCRAVGLKSK